MAVFFLVRERKMNPISALLTFNIQLLWLGPSLANRVGRLTTVGASIFSCQTLQHQAPVTHDDSFADILSEFFSLKSGCFVLYLKKLHLKASTCTSYLVCWKHCRRVLPWLCFVCKQGLTSKPSITYIEPPGCFVDCRFRIDVAFKVDIVSFFDFIGIKCGSKCQLSKGYICNTIVYTLSSSNLGDNYS